MNAAWSGLLANLAIVALSASLWTFVQDYLPDASRRLRAVALGLLMGVGAAATMLTPLEIRHGVFLDLRAALIAIAGFFGGPLSALVAALVAMAARVPMGGVGILAGFFEIAISATVGLAFFALRKGRAPDRRDVLVLSSTVALGGLVSFAVLLNAIWIETAAVMAAPIATALFIATMVAALSILQENKRREATNANRLYRAIMEALPDSLNVKDTAGRFIVANPPTAALMRAASVDALTGRTDFDFYPPDIARGFRDDEEALLRSGAPAKLEQRYAYSNGSGGWLSTLKVPLRDDTGAIVGIITHNREITDRKRLEAELAQSEQRLAHALEHMADALVMFDADGVLVFSNPQYAGLFPLTADVRKPGVHFRAILRAALDRGEETIAAEKQEEWIEKVCASLKSEGSRQIVLDDGRWLEARTRLLAQGGCLIVFSDITNAKAAERALLQLNEQLDALATTDGLTGLMNRRAFDLALDRELARAARENASISLMLIDVDAFKSFNDLYGHPEGDRVLQTISNCLNGSVRFPTDIAARYGGEELAAIMPGADIAAALEAAERFCAAIRDFAIVHAGSPKGIVTVSVGVVSVAPASGATRALDLIRRADSALYAAKHAGRDCVRAAPMRSRTRLEGAA
jgi:diguanylate cyclase (GGDEF)-like protein/PAS domain S-box-containing protein